MNESWNGMALHHCKMTSVISTGTLSESPKSIKKLLKECNIKYVGDINRTTYALLSGKNPKELKLDSARLNDIPIVDGDWFISELRRTKQVPDISHFTSITSPTIKRSKRRSLTHAEFPDLIRSKSPSYTSSNKKRKISGNRVTNNASSEEFLSALSSLHQDISQSDRHFYRSEDHKGHVIAMEGLIGIGKSTLSLKMKEDYPDECEIYSEETNESFLQLFYSNPAKYGFAMQWGMLKSRLFQLRLSQHDTKHGRWPYRELYFWDRSMVGDYIFALLNHLKGSLSREEMKVYESEFGGSFKNAKSIPHFKDIDLFVLMSDEPSQCKYRLENVRKNTSESSIPLDYYEGLDDIHFYAFMKMLTEKLAKVVVQVWGQYNQTAETRALYESIISGNKQLPTAEVMSSLPDFMQIDEYIYEDEDSIAETYENISDDDEKLQGFKDFYKKVYVPVDIMTIDPETKGYDAELVKEYGITCYKNA